MRTIFTAWVGLLLTLSPTAGVDPAAAQFPASHYCGERLIRLGTSIEEIPGVCGEPDSKLQRFGSHCSTVWSGQRSCVATLIDEWVYDYGPSRLKRRLVFANARLVDVRTEGFGARTGHP